LENEDDRSYLDILAMAIGFLEVAIHSRDKERMGAYLNMASRSLQRAMEIDEDRLAEMEEGEEVK
jgi:hypothetical protein